MEAHAWPLKIMASRKGQGVKGYSDGSHTCPNKIEFYFSVHILCNTTSATITLVITVPVGSGDTRVGDDTEGMKRRAVWAVY